MKNMGNRHKWQFEFYFFCLQLNIICNNTEDDPWKCFSSPKSHDVPLHLEIVINGSIISYMSLWKSCEFGRLIAGCFDVMGTITSCFFMFLQNCYLLWTNFVITNSPRSFWFYHITTYWTIVNHLHTQQYGSHQSWQNGHEKAFHASTKFSAS